MDAVSALIIIVVMIVTIICLGFALIIDAIGKVSAQVTVIENQTHGLDGDIGALYEIMADRNNPPYIRKPKKTQVRR